MANVIKLRKGLDINLVGAAEDVVGGKASSILYGMCPDAFPGVKPKVVVHAGDRVEAGAALFVNKNCLDVVFPSPVSGIVKDVVRGERRKLLAVTVESDGQPAHDFGRKEVSALNAQGVKSALLEGGLFGFIRQLPYDVSTTPDTTPKGIFVSAFRDMPLAANFEVELKGEEQNFQAGLTALSKIATTYLGISPQQSASALTGAKDVEINIFDGRCPAGNVGVQVNHINPVNKGEVVWTVDPMVVIFIGRLLNTGKLDLSRRIAVAGSEVSKPTYVETCVGAQLSDVLTGRLKSQEHVRIINGNPLTGKPASQDDFLAPYASEVCAIPEGNNADELLGWILPRKNMFSTSRSYLSWLLPKSKKYALDARVKGSERHMIMSGEYDSVLPMDIYGEYLIKAIIAEDIDKQEELGIYEVSPEDFAVAEFVDSSKLPLQQIVRDGLDALRKENA